ncbi:hypothetical protein SESBI_17448 [Sesbania bispinosa]|nr:hypothetical protein SESBI_17448 [Sesbania bispinosa]
MKCKNICFCIRGCNRKTPADDGASSNVHGASSTVATSDAGVAAAVATAAHHVSVSLMSAQDGSGHGGESAGG